MQDKTVFSQSSEGQIAQAPQEVQNVIEQASEPIFQLKTIFPFKPFPTTITIDTQKISIVNQTFFFSEDRISIPISEIFTVECNTNLFFAKLIIRDKRFDQQPVEIDYLQAEEAKKARRIMQGLITLKIQNNGDLPKMTADQIEAAANEVGSTHVE